MDYATFKGLKPGQFENAADGYRKTSHMAGHAKDDIDQQITVKMRQSLSGDATDAAVTQLRKLSKNFHYTQVECGLAGTALTALASELRAAKKKLDAAVDDAHAEGFTVESDGSVTYPAGGKKEHGKPPAGGTATADAPTKQPSTPLDTRGEANSLADAVSRQSANVNPNPHAAKAHAIAVRIAAAVKEATEADQKWAPQLRKLKADDDLSVSSADWADAQQDTRGTAKDAQHYLDQHVKSPPKHGSPGDNATWWKDLSREDKDAYVSMHPASIGAMDGLPADVRDEANRAVLAEKRGEYQTKLDAIPPEPPRFGSKGHANYQVRPHSKEYAAWREKYLTKKQHLQGALKGMDAIEQRFTKTGEDGLPKAYLLGFNPDNNGRAIVANGNPDTSDHTAVYVPGTSANLSGIGGDIRRSTEIWRTSNNLPGNPEVSTVAWLNYDAPQSLPLDSPRGHYANDGAAQFNNFMDGLNTTNTTDSGGHHTVIGHSYGSTLIGSAARQGDLSADDIVFCGSPGAQVGEATDMDVPKGHVWNEEASDDAVPEIGASRHGGIQWDPGDHPGSPATPPHEDLFGPRKVTRAITPSDEVFGAKQMSTDTSGHPHYWNPGSQSIINQAAVAAGEYRRVTLED